MECVRVYVGGGSHAITLNAFGSKKPKPFESCVLLSVLSTKCGFHKTMVTPLTCHLWDQPMGWFGSRCGCEPIGFGLLG